MDGLLIEHVDRNAKFVGKCFDRFTAMLHAARTKLKAEAESETIRGVVLLGADQLMCRSRTLPKLLEAEIVVQRRA